MKVNVFLKYKYKKKYIAKWDQNDPPPLFFQISQQHMKQFQQILAIPKLNKDR